ncbi:hypothetical protein SISSUDRAFT_95818 [Sistotremastrum suecicum HHB10207 ss-3]|uniref:Uncharacterized protein n=1 Tax=Sistotremastrum suecicum HHB10207 ss-3 TaxID=1314776 RepID=A0A166B795_9AGAM|nr:hypothetical protein SISSUDRAFT_95818 [Sistotremastrum suecicum HHB10207 ss-3]
MHSIILPINGFLWMKPQVRVISQALGPSCVVLERLTSWMPSQLRLHSLMAILLAEEHQRTEMDKVWATISHQNILDAIAGATKDLQPKLSSKTNSSMMALDINDFLTACLGKICKE